MNWINFLTYGDSYQKAFETLCNQLFERYLRRVYGSDLLKFRVINGAGGDGGIEAYGELRNGNIIAVQTKWFRDVLADSQVSQIKRSLTSALSLRPRINEYIICIPRTVNSTKFGRGKSGQEKKPIKNTEEKRLDRLESDMKSLYPGLSITWWFEQALELQMQEKDNEGVHRYWFDKEFLSFQHLVNKFNLQKAGWLYERYIPELHAQGYIQRNIEQLLYVQRYREDLLRMLEIETEAFSNAAELLRKFIPTISKPTVLQQDLTNILRWLNLDLPLISEVKLAIRTGKGEFALRLSHQETIAASTLDALYALSPVNKQIGLTEKLIEELDYLNKIKLDEILADVQREVRQNGMLFLGDAGTGKTHGLSNAVEKQLQALAPAVIISAKGTPCRDWTEILSIFLEAPGWDKFQLLSALETLAIRCDHRLAASLLPGTEPQDTTKVILCIDGLEEDTDHWADWYARIRESIVLMQEYPLVKFVYSARPYFYNKKELFVSESFEVKTLPKGGDVSVYKVMDRYFSPGYFNISVTPKTLIRGLDSLFALRLFCEQYRGQTLTMRDDIVQTESVLLQKKIERMDKEFIALYVQEADSVRTPVLDGMEVITDCFFSNYKVDHDALFDLLGAVIGKYVNKQQIDHLIDYLSANGMLIQNKIFSKGKLLGKNTVYYELPYQSIIDLVMGHKYASAIASGELTQLPEMLLPSRAPEGLQASDASKTEEEGYFVGARIVQSIANGLLYEHGKMIGENGFLSPGLTPQEIAKLQTTALIKAPPQRAQKYRKWVTDTYLMGSWERLNIFQNLIYPSAESAAYYFGADFLHDLLMQPPTAFARENIWLGDDGILFDTNEKPIKYKGSAYRLESVIEDVRIPVLDMPDDSLHNEYPLLFGWALATLDQKFRYSLRFALAYWAIDLPMEYLLLLRKLFACGDPQIQEDLASVTLGVASRLQDHAALLALANWALDNIFSDVGRHRNVIVRQGFRAVVEKAYKYGLLSEGRVEKARPKPLTILQLLPLDKSVLQEPREEIYPIVHDLAWYVIKRSFREFLDYDSAENDSNTNVQMILKNGNTADDAQVLDPHTWAMAAAIAYMKSMGFNRVDGNNHTQGTHGSKSQVFTLEEKYTWLAVHYIQGYLADYLALKDSQEFVSDYSQITDISNPAEYFSPAYDLIEGCLIKYDWIIQEDLVQELQQHSDYEEAIRQNVQAEPSIRLEHWICYQDADFLNPSAAKGLLALFNRTALHDSRYYISSRIDLRACVIEKGQATVIKDLLLTSTQRISFAETIDRMHANPRTYIYSNPSDVVWMKWIDDVDEFETYYDNDNKSHNLYYTVASITNNRIDEEHEVKIPSKFVRDLLDIVEMDEDAFYNNHNDITAVRQHMSKDRHDNQEIVVVYEKALLELLDKKGYELVWFAELLTSKNALNDEIKSDQHPMKCRKYFVHLEDGVMHTTKYWDARFSNARHPVI